MLCCAGTGAASHPGTAVKSAVPGEQRPASSVSAPSAGPHPCLAPGTTEHKATHSAQPGLATKVASKVPGGHSPAQVFIWVKQ